MRRHLVDTCSACIRHNRNDSNENTERMKIKNQRNNYNTITTDRVDWVWGKSKKICMESSSKRFVCRVILLPKHFSIKSNESTHTHNIACIRYDTMQFNAMRYDTMKWDEVEHCLPTTPHSSECECVFVRVCSARLCCLHNLLLNTLCEHELQSWIFFGAELSFDSGFLFPSFGTFVRASLNQFLLVCVFYRLIAPQFYAIPGELCKWLHRCGNIQIKHFCIYICTQACLVMLLKIILNFLYSTEFFIDTICILWNGR